jgi:3-oxoacyl-(acyl-carrier-protein) synthase
MIPMNDKVIITGMAAASSFGLDKGAMLRAIKERKYCVMSKWEETQVNGITQVGLMDRSAFVLEKYRRATGSSQSLALFAHVAEQALMDAGLSDVDRLCDPLPILLGSNYGFPVPYLELFNLRNKNDKSQGESVMEPMFQLNFREDAITQCLQKYLGCDLNKICVNMQCTSSIFAMIIASAKIKNGEISHALVGGYDFFEPSTYQVMQMAGLIDKKRAVPFSKKHDGFNYGEGLGFLVLENENTARKRGVGSGYGRVQGHAVHCSPSDGAPSVSAIMKTIETSLKNAGLRRQNIDFISPHGCGIPDMDNAESSAMKRYFGDSIKNIPMANYTPLVGYSFAASAILDLVTILTGLKEGAVLPGDIPKDPNEISDFNFFSSPLNPDAVCHVLKLKMGYSGSIGALIVSTEDKRPL